MRFLSWHGTKIHFKDVDSTPCFTQPGSKKTPVLREFIWQLKAGYIVNNLYNYFILLGNFLRFLCCHTCMAFFKTAVCPVRWRWFLSLVEQLGGKGRSAKAVIDIEGGHAGHAGTEHG